MDKEDTITDPDMTRYFLLTVAGIFAVAMWIISTTVAQRTVTISNGSPPGFILSCGPASEIQRIKSVQIDDKTLYVSC